MKQTKPLLQGPPRPPQLASISDMFRYASKKDYILFGLGLAATICHSVLPGFLALNVGRIFNKMGDNSDLDEFYDAQVSIAQLLYGLGIFALCIGIIAVSSFIKVGTVQSLAYRHHYFAALVNKRLQYYDTNNAAQMATAVDMECSTIEQASGQKLMVFFDAIFMFINSWTIATLISAQLALLTLTQLPIQLIASRIIKGAGLGGMLKLQAAYKSAGGVSEEALYQVKTVAALNAQQMVASQYQEKLRPLLSIQTKDGFTFGIGWSLYYSVLFVFQGLMFFVGALLLQVNGSNWITGIQISPGYILTVFFAVAVSSHQLGNALPAIGFINGARASVGKIIPIIEAPVYSGGTLDASGVKGHITFENIKFSYPSKPENLILDDFKLEIQPGRSVAMVGETGSGKSTIINLVQQFYQPLQGRINIDNVDIRTYNLTSLRDQMALVSQEPILFNMSIKENILVGKQNASDHEIIQSARYSGIHDFITGLPEQYATFVGAKGSQLSGGQKQRIAIARAIIRNPKILLLDEATSALDTRTQQAIQQTLDSLMAGRTTLIVAQRLSTVKKADMICVLSGKQVAESGSHQELLEYGGIYANLFSMQGGSEVPVEQEIKSKVQEGPKSSAFVSAAVQQQSETSVMMRVLGLITAYWKWLVVAVFAAIISGGVFPVFGFFFAINSNALINPENEEKSDDVLKSIIPLCVMAVVVILALTFLTGSLTRITALFTFDMRFKALKSYLFYDNEFYDNPINHPAVLSSRLSTDCAKVNAIGGPVIGVQLLAFAAVIIALVISSRYSISLGCLVAVCLPLIYIGQKNGRLSQIRGFAVVSHENATTVASDTMMNLRTVHAFNYQERCIQKYYECAKGVAEDANRASYRSGFFFGYMILILYFTYGSASWYGAWLVKQDGLSFDSMTIAFFTVMFATWAFTIVGALSPDIQAGIKAAKNLFKTIDYKPKIDAESSSGLKSPIEGKIQFDRVSFQYPNREVAVLKNFSIKLHPGESLGIAGSTGSGKSTIVQLLLRFYNPSTGRILIDDKEISTYNLKHLRQSIGWVGQQPALFSGTIRHNLLLANPEASDRQMYEACDAAQAMNFISKYEKQLDMDVGLKGSLLSGGQKQRVGIARALIKKPKILILDEATSALDSQTEKEVQKAIAELDVTVIAIAHRLSTIQESNQIVVMELGDIVEVGTHTELVNAQGAYYRMLNV